MAAAEASVADEPLTPTPSNATPPITPPAAVPHESATGATPETIRRRQLVVVLAVSVTLTAIPIRLYWALGGTWGLPGGTAVAELPGLHPTNAAVVGILAAGAALLTGLTRPWARRVPAALVLGPIWVGSILCISHGLYGTITKALYAVGVHSAVDYIEPLTDAQKNLMTVRDLCIFEPWFLAQGLLLLFAGRWFTRTKTRRHWTLSVLAGTVLLDALGVALTITHQRLAVN